METSSKNITKQDKTRSHGEGSKCQDISSDPIQLLVRQADTDHDETIDPSSVRGVFSCTCKNCQKHLMETFTGKIHVTGVLTFDILLARSARLQIE